MIGGQMLDIIGEKKEFDHALGEERAARNRGADVRRVVGGRGELLQVLAPHLQLVPQVERARVGEHEVAFDVQLPEALEKPNPIDCAGRSRDPDDQAFLHGR